MLVRSMQSMQTYQTAFKQETQERPRILSWSKPVCPWTSLAWTKGLNLRNLFAVPWECGLFLPLPCPEHNSIEIRNSTFSIFSSLAVNLQSVTSPGFVQKALLFKEGELLRALAARLLNKVLVCA